MGILVEGSKLVSAGVQLTSGLQLYGDEYHRIVELYKNG
jgi:hypothetical protein